MSSVPAIEQAFVAAGVIPLSAQANERFLAYLELLLRWNARFNLTAVRDPGEIIQKHLVECAFAAQHLPSDIETLMDFGSGAGLPGIAIAICRPEIKVVLAEAHGKKASFLREAVRVIGAATEIYEGRVENMPQGQTFHAVAIRAVEKMELAILVAALRAERYLAVLTTQKASIRYGEIVPEFEWPPGIPLPDSNQKILALGKRLV